MGHCSAWLGCWPCCHVLVLLSHLLHFFSSHWLLPHRRPRFRQTKLHLHGCCSLHSWYIDIYIYIYIYLFTTLNYIYAWCTSLRNLLSIFDQVELKWRLVGWFSTWIFLVLPLDTLLQRLLVWCQCDNFLITSFFAILDLIQVKNNVAIFGWFGLICFKLTGRSKDLIVSMRVEEIIRAICQAIHTWSCLVSWKFFFLKSRILIKFGGSRLWLLSCLLPTLPLVLPLALSKLQVWNLLQKQLNSWFYWV